MATIDFNTSDYQDGGSYEPIPRGEYILQADSAELKTSSKGGQYIKTVFEVLGPTNVGRKVFVNYNIVNASDKAQDIGRKQLSSWARAVGKPNATDTDQLLNIPFKALITVEKGSNGYGDSNSINSYKANEPNTAFGGNESAQPPKAAVVAENANSAFAATPPAGKAKAPWDI